MKRLSLGALAVVLAASSAMAAPSLSVLAPFGTETSSSASSITPDGQWVVGQSGTGRGVLWNTAAPGTAINVLGGGMQSEYVRGVAYRTEPFMGRQELVMLGKTAGTVGPTFWFYRPSDQTWGPKLRHTNETNALPAANALASRTGVSDGWFATWGAGTTGGQGKVGIGWGGTDTVAPSTMYDQRSNNQEISMKGVSSTGRAVGFRRDSGDVPRNYILDFVDDGVAGNANATMFDGLAGAGDTRGQAWAVNGDGTRVFGMSPVSDGRSGNWPYMCTNPGAGQTIVELPTFSDTAGSTTNALPYGASASGNYAVGMNYRGMEKAVLWDVQAMTITDLTEYFSNEGLLGSFTRLTRAYSVADLGGGNVWITGIGVTPEGTRGFVAFIPEPASLGLLALGGLLALRRRR